MTRSPALDPGIHGSRPAGRLAVRIRLSGSGESAGETAQIGRNARFNRPD